MSCEAGFIDSTALALARLLLVTALLVIAASAGACSGDSCGDVAAANGTRRLAPGLLKNFDRL